jgi:hypothetical protein
MGDLSFQLTGAQRASSVFVTVAAQEVLVGTAWPVSTYVGEVMEMVDDERVTVR